MNCNVNGADVYFDNEYKGTIEAGVLYVPVYTTGTPYQTFRMEKDGYTTYNGEVTSVPGKGEVFDLYAGTKLEPFPQAVRTSGNRTGAQKATRRLIAATLAVPEQALPPPIPLRGIADRSPPA